jgi:hypothetical protein
MMWVFALSAAFLPQQGINAGRRHGINAGRVHVRMMPPRPIHTDGFTSYFKVEPASEELMKELGVNNWPTWSTEGSEKYDNDEQRFGPPAPRPFAFR